jgi:chromosomal replication initiation ATPase DnaA
LKRFREKIPIDKIIKTCCEYYGKKKEELHARGKGKKERKTLIYLSKVMSKDSYWGHVLTGCPGMQHTVFLSI